MKTMKISNVIFNLEYIEFINLFENKINVKCKSNNEVYSFEYSTESLTQEECLSAIFIKLKREESFDLIELFDYLTGEKQKWNDSENSNKNTDSETQEYFRKMGYTEWEQREMKAKTVGTTENPATSLDIANAQKEIQIESELL